MSKKSQKKPAARHLVAITPETYEQLRYGLPNLRNFVSSMCSLRVIPRPEELKDGLRDVDNKELVKELHAVGEMLGVLNVTGYALWDIVEKAEEFLAGLKTMDVTERNQKRSLAWHYHASHQKTDKALRDEILRLKLRLSASGLDGELE